LSLFSAIILGIVQGLTELFPVSSSAHLVILQSFLPGFNQPGVAFDAMLHLGTLFAVVFYFRADLRNMLKALLPQKYQSAEAERNNETVTLRKLALFLIIGTIPAALFGLLFQDDLHKVFESARAAAFFLIITGFLLYFSDKVTDAKRDEKDMNITDCILIGLAQAVALLPGISRSGATITMGIFRKLNRPAAARFSFLLSIPAVFGAVVLESRYLKNISYQDMGLYFTGFICAAFAGFLSLKLFFLIIRQARLKFFAYYCWILGAFTILVKSDFF